MKSSLKKALSLTLALIMLLALFSGCGSKAAAPANAEQAPASEEAAPADAEKPQEPVEPPAEPEKTYTLRMASPASSNTVTAKFMQWFCDEVTARSEGRLDVKYFPDSQLYKPAEIPEAVISGAIDLAHCSTAVYWPTVCPVFTYTQEWFLWRTTEQLEANLDDYRDLFFPLWEAQDVKPLFFVDQGEGGLLTKTAVTKPEDLKGLVMRGSSSPDFDAMNALGATPVQMAVGEAYDALEKGALDGDRASYSNFVAKQMYEVCDYLLPGVTMTLFGVLVNVDVWESLPADLQELIMEVGKETEARSFADHAAEEEKMLKTLEEHCTVYTLSEEEVAVFQEALKPTYDSLLVLCEEQGYKAEAERFLEIASR